MRKLILNLHLYIGLTVAIVMAMLSVTGAFLVFELNVDHFLNARLDRVQPQGTAISLDQLRGILERREPGYLVTEIILPERASSSTLFHLDSLARHKSRDLYVNQYTGEILGASAQRNQFAKKVRQFHTQLLAGFIGNQIVTWSSAGLAVLAVSGLILWWPRKVITVKAGSSLPRLNNDLHHSLGFWSSWAMLLFAATGLMLHFAHTPDDDPYSASATVTRAAKQASLAQIVSAAQQCFPDGAVMRMSIPLNAAQPVSVGIRLPEDRTPLGRSSVTVDRITGAVVAKLSTRKAPLRYRLLKLWTRELHTGDIYGWPTRILAAVSSLALAMLAFSGAMIWINGKMAAARGRRALEHRREIPIPRATSEPPAFTGVHGRR
jgi:uncharacterized iron-regulated membrane protein